MLSAKMSRERKQPNKTSRDRCRSNTNIDRRQNPRSGLLCYAFVFELDIDQDEIHKALFVMKAIN